MVNLCYQLPALISEGTAIVVSPLIALMKNQVDAIRQVSEVDGVAHFLNSSLNKGEVNKVKSDVKVASLNYYTLHLNHLPKKKILNFLPTLPYLFCYR